MSLSGRPLLTALLGAALLGVLGGSFAAGWRKARGLPPVCSTDAGVQLQVDAGVTARGDCTAVIEHWKTVEVPGPVRYIPEPDGGLAPQPEVVTVLVPDVRLNASTATTAAIDVGAQAEVSTQAAAVAVPPDRHWEVGPAVFRTPDHDVWVGGMAGWSAGPFGVRGLVLGNPKGVAAGVGVVWRW